MNGAMFFGGWFDGGIVGRQVLLGEIMAWGIEELVTLWETT